MDWPLLRSLDDVQRAQVLAATQRRTFRRSQTVFHEGDPGDTLHLLQKGHVAIRVATSPTEFATIRVLAPGQWFGEMALISDEPRMASVVALEAVETRTLHRDDFVALATRQPALERVLLDAMTAEVRRLSVALAEAMYLPVTKRLPRLLLSMAATYGSDTVPLTQDDLAGLCGATRQTVNQLLAEMQADDVISVGRGKVLLLDRDRLERAAR
jgi:CRP-like cAMP-binding protein